MANLTEDIANAKELEMVLADFDELTDDVDLEIMMNRHHPVQGPQRS